MKRSGFTMIELIFVIVIIGILSAVALPKFLGVATSAHLAKVKSYVGTFNMTTGPALWSTSLSSGDNGSVTKTIYATKLANQLPHPAELTTFNGLKNCTVTTLPKVGTNTSVALTNPFASFTLNGKTYDIGCVNGSPTSSPILWIQIGAKPGQAVILN